MSDNGNNSGHGGCWWIIVIALGIAVGLYLFATEG